MKSFYRTFDSIGTVHVKLKSHFFQQQSEIGHFFLIRKIVDPVHKRNIGFVTMSHKMSYLPIGQQHKFFDEEMGIQSFTNLNINRFFVFIQNNLHFIGIEFDGFFFHPPLSQRLRNPIQQSQFLLDRTYLSVTIDDPLCLFITQVMIRMNDRLPEPGIDDAEVFIKFHHHRKSHTIFSRTK